MGHTPIKKSTDGEIVALGPVRIYYREKEKELGHFFYDFGEYRTSGEYGKSAIEAQIARAIQDKPSLFADSVMRPLMIIITDKEQKQPTRIFAGTSKEKDGKMFLTINKTLNLDISKNPYQEVETLDDPIKIELNNGAIRQADVDKLQALIKSGKLVKVSPVQGGTRLASTDEAHQWGAAPVTPNPRAMAAKTRDPNNGMGA